MRASRLSRSRPRRRRRSCSGGPRHSHSRTQRRVPCALCLVGTRMHFAPELGSNSFENLNREKDHFERIRRPPHISARPPVHPRTLIAHISGAKVVPMWRNAKHTGAPSCLHCVRVLRLSVRLSACPRTGRGGPFPQRRGHASETHSGVRPPLPVRAPVPPVPPS
jgi:hypothetical protein